MRKGTPLMILGALLIAAALFLTARNLLEEQTAGSESSSVLAELVAAIPEAEQAEAQSALTITDSQGNPVDWPLDETGAPMPWPVDDAGRPVAQVVDASGRTVEWPKDEAGNPAPWKGGRWTVEARGLLPWVTDEDGVTARWPLNLAGLLCTLEEIRGSWELLVQKMQDSLEQEQPDFVQNPKKEMPTAKVKGNDYIGVVDIPSLNLSLPVMSSWSYPKLRKAPCRFEGSVYTGDLIVAGHNYNRHFGRLKNLVRGTEVRFTDVDGNVFIYQVLGTEELGGYDLHRMRAGEWDLTLFTCTYGGGSRITVRCGLTGTIPVQ